MANNVVYRVFTVDIRTPLGAFCAAANHVMLDSVSPSSDSCSSLSLRITSITRQFRLALFSREAYACSAWSSTLELVADVPIADYSPNDARSDDILRGIPPLSIVKVSPYMIACSMDPALGVTI